MELRQSADWVDTVKGLRHSFRLNHQAELPVPIVLACQGSHPSTSASASAASEESSVRNSLARTSSAALIHLHFQDSLASSHIQNAAASPQKPDLFAAVAAVVVVVVVVDVAVRGLVALCLH